MGTRRLVKLIKEGEGTKLAKEAALGGLHVCYCRGRQARAGEGCVGGEGGLVTRQRQSLSERRDTPACPSLSTTSEAEVIITIFLSSQLGN